jgi:hypothetical protein
MSTHAYRAMEEALQKRGEPGIYSYLDADTLEIVVNTPDRLLKRYMHLALEVDVEDLLILHGREKISFQKDPFHPEIGKALVSYCQDGENRSKWLDWTDRNLKMEGGRDLNETVAKDVHIPDIFPIIGGKLIKDLKEEWGRKAKSIAKWLHGRWLDDYVHYCATKAGEKTNVHQVVSSLSPQGIVNFEVDVAAMQGYRMFAISVTTVARKNLAKLKLFEVMVRARQMGGDEAKVALVSFGENPEELEKEVGEQLMLIGQHIEKGWQSPVRVFGIRELPYLEDHLQKWFEEV